MKILFLGETEGNTGPGNANKAILKNLTNAFICVKSRNKYGKMLEGIWKCLHSDVTVISGISRKGCVLAFFAKRTVYIMHGCARREASADGLDVKAAIRQERYLLKKADLLLPVSRKFADWVKGAYPQYAYKTGYLHPGLESFRVTEQKKPGSVIAAGGDSTIKNNAALARAVACLDGRAELEVYGHLRRREPEFLPYTQWRGAVSHDEFLRKLARSEVFVLNSLFETFSLTAIEALNCGCSVLVSEGAGVTEVVALEESDILRDPTDVEEIQQKLAFLLENPNNERLLQALDFEELSGKSCARRLEGKCAELMGMEKNR